MDREFKDFISKGNIYSRNNPIGHITGSCWIVSRDKKRVLLTHHKKLNIWIPTGGHSDGETDPLSIAIREGFEETGLKLTPYNIEPFYLDIHLIPKYKEVKEHKHFDYTYIFYPTYHENFTVSDESFNLKWIPIDRIEEYTKEENVLKMAKKTMEMEWNIEITTY